MSDGTRNSVGPRGQMVIGAIFIVAAIVVGMLALGDLKVAQAEQAASGWPPVSGTVVSSGIRQLRGSNTPDSKDWVPDVRYTYEVDGERFSGDRYAFHTSSSRGQSKAAARIKAEKYVQGSALRVLVDPDDSSNSVIVASSMFPFQAWLFVAFSGLGGLVGLGLLGFGAKGMLAGR